jgi:hypothetical protein
MGPVQYNRRLDLRKLVLSLLAACSMVLGADVSGTWKGNSYRTDGTPAMDIVLILKQAEAKITGTVGPNVDEQIPISAGKVDGEKLYFEVVTENGTYKVSMTAGTEDLKGSAIRTLDGQDSPPMKVELKRSK